MLVTKHFIFAHVPKTGGSFIKKVCREHLPADWIITDELGVHAPLRTLPESYAGLPIFGLVRNPWDWYVSWYAFIIQRYDTLSEQAKSALAPYFGKGDVGFEEMVRAACTGIPVAGAQADGRLPKLRKGNADYYTWMHNRVFFRPPEGSTLEIGRFENLRDSFSSFLVRHRIPVDDSFLNRVQDEGAEKVSKRDHYAAYYDAELRDLVASRNALVDEFGYSFEETAAGSLT
jgi:hypothetical protein